MSKHFLITPEVNYSSKEVVESIHLCNIRSVNKNHVSRETLAKNAISKDVKLKHVYGRVVLKVDMESKNYHTFSDGTIIRRERKFNNFNFREVMPTNCIVISAENIPFGAEVLVDYTSIHDSYKIFDCDSGSDDVSFYSIKEEECYAWREGKGEWLPTKNTEFGLRLFVPYNGVIEGIEPTVMKDVLYVTTGEFKGQVVNTLKGCDYCMVLQGDDGKERQILRFRHSNDEGYDREEVICINHELTEKVNKGQIYVGLSSSDAKPFNYI